MLDGVEWIWRGLCIASVLLVGDVAAARGNYDESKVGDHPLPNVLADAEGQAITTVKDWEQRRTEWLALVHDEMYGHAPGRPEAVRYEVIDDEADALGGKARRKQIRIHLGAGAGPVLNVLCYLPKSEKPVPVFFMLNFRGNQSIQADPAIRMSTSYNFGRDRAGVKGNRATEEGRGIAAGRWPVEMIVAAGYGLVTMHCADADPDRKTDSWADGVHPLYYKDGQTRPGPKEWGTVSAWAWGCSRVLDYLETDPAVRSDRVIIAGHSRLGKTSILAGARDERFAAVISNNSGCGGAALSRRNYGETLPVVNKSFPHWFCSKFDDYNKAPETLPFDQHVVLACVAPRPLLVCSAEGDRWADPRGEFLAAKHASAVYGLYGKSNLAERDFPKPTPDQLYNSTVAYHYRTGKHDVTIDDWRAYLAFANAQLGQ